MMQTYQLLVLALTVEALWETLKMLWQDGKICFDRLGAVILGIILCIMARVDFFSIVGIPLAYQVVGYTLSGVIISRGSNALHDLLSAIAKLADNA